MGVARDLSLDALVEAHTAAELDRAVSLGADPIGINARDLRPFRIDRSAQLDLVASDFAPRESKGRRRGERDRVAGAGCRC